MDEYLISEYEEFDRLMNKSKIKSSMIYSNFYLTYIVKKICIGTSTYCRIKITGFITQNNTNKSKSYQIVLIHNKENKS
jgi:hypothetical protein